MFMTNEANVKNEGTHSSSQHTVASFHAWVCQQKLAELISHYTCYKCSGYYKLHKHNL